MAKPINSEIIHLKNTSLKDNIEVNREEVDLSKYFFVGTFFEKDCYFLLENLEVLNAEAGEQLAAQAAAIDAQAAADAAAADEAAKIAKK